MVIEFMWSQSFLKSLVYESLGLFDLPDMKETWGEIEVGAVLALLMCSYWARSHVDRLHFFPATANAPNHVPSTNIEVFCFTESPSSTHKLACPPIIVLPWRWPAEITVHSCNWFSFAAGQPTLFAKNLISPLEFYWKIACY